MFRFVGGGHTTFCGFLNMGIHTIMYFYYFLAALGPQVQKYLWWKKYLTKMQMAQFALFFLHAIQPIFIDCGFPVVFSYIILFHGFMFFVLFANFYVQSYLKKDPRAKKEAKSNGAPASFTYCYNNGIDNGLDANANTKKEN